MQALLYNNFFKPDLGLRPFQGMTMNVAESGLLTSRELARFFQDEFQAATQMQVRWAAESVQSVRPLEQGWSVPFRQSGQGQGAFHLGWDHEFQRFLAGKLGEVAARPEFLGGILRATAARWAEWSTLHGGTSIRLQPSPDSNVRQRPTHSLCAALIIDSFVLELNLALEAPTKL